MTGPSARSYEFDRSNESDRSYEADARDAAGRYDGEVGLNV
jgi:hypothetical protein